MRFTATQELAVEEVAFSWRARFGPLLRVVDRFEAGAGLLEARLLGLVPVMRASGPEVDAGEAMRYLAELPWVPHALVANRQLDWREIDERTVEVGTRVGAATAAVRLELDEAGDIVGASTDARPRMEKGRAVPTPWTGRFEAYATLGGIRVPTHGAVHWELPDGPFTYWEAEITALEVEAGGITP